MLTHIFRAFAIDFKCAITRKSRDSIRCLLLSVQLSICLFLSFYICFIVTIAMAQFRFSHSFLFVYEFVRPSSHKIIEISQLVDEKIDFQATSDL